MKHQREVDTGYFDAVTQTDPAVVDHGAEGILRKELDSSKSMTDTYDGATCRGRTGTRHRNAGGGSGRWEDVQLTVQNAGAADRQRSVHGRWRGETSQKGRKRPLLHRLAEDRVKINNLGAASRGCDDQRREVFSTAGRR